MPLGVSCEKGGRLHECRERLSREDTDTERELAPIPPKCEAQQGRPVQYAATTGKMYGTGLGPLEVLSAVEEAVRRPRRADLFLSPQMLKGGRDGDGHHIITALAIGMYLLAHALRVGCSVMEVLALAHMSNARAFSVMGETREIVLARQKLQKQPQRRRQQRQQTGVGAVPMRSPAHQRS